MTRNSSRPTSVWICGVASPPCGQSAENPKTTQIPFETSTAFAGRADIGKRSPTRAWNLQTGVDGGTGTDMSCDGEVATDDVVIYFQPQLGAGVPGPSGLECAGEPYCP